MEYYQQLKRTKLLICTMTWINLKSTTLSEQSQTQKTSYGHLFDIPEKAKYDDRKLIVADRRGGRWRGLAAKGHEETFWGNETVL